MKKKFDTAKTTGWINGDGKVYTDDEVLSYFKSYDNADSPAQYAVGTDSNLNGRIYKFVVVVCAYKENKGGVFFYKKIYQPKENFFNNAKVRLFEETTKSLEIAELIKNKLGKEPQVHVDASDPTKSRAYSSAFADQLKGYVNAYGYHCELKPSSWAASSIANKFTKF